MKDLFKKLKAINGEITIEYIKDKDEFYITMKAPTYTGEIGSRRVLNKILRSSELRSITAEEILIDDMIMTFILEQNS